MWIIAGASAEHMLSWGNRGRAMSSSVESPPISTECTRCKIKLIGPEWSETVGERQTVHVWRCPICGNEFETTEDHVEQPLPDAELVEEFLPNLMVA
jgi:ribosomal protein L37AE/L43A